MQILENLKEHTQLDAAGRRKRATELLDLVGIPAAQSRLNDYPHQFSGGMRQRAMIAIALASNPKLLLADEPTTALDVTIQDQILKLILRLRSEMNMSVVLVTHDLGVIAQTCDRLAVMYAGRVVETGPVTALFKEPRHAYTLGLLNSVPRADLARQPLSSISGQPPLLFQLPPGCAFAPRCRFMTQGCTEAKPPLVEVATDHRSACIHHDKVAQAKP
jgi:peptide/nickel transport system ATP-binding protein/oligopeptide transport system ATP-binding protein